MIKLSGKEGLADELNSYLRAQAEMGLNWVVYDSDQPLSSVFDLNCFHGSAEAFADAAEYQQIFNWHQAVPIADMISWIARMEPEILLNNPKGVYSINCVKRKINNFKHRNYVRSTRRESFQL